MKVILSRKGFDSEYGGGPSPIIDGRRLVSLPINYDKETRRRYNELRFGDENLGLLIESLYPKRIKATDFCHVDPDIRAETLSRSGDWRPMFGQVDQSASHLVDTHVQAGDLFLFFGLFRKSDGWRRFQPGAPKRHVIWGWLQVDEVIHDPVGWSHANRWASEHPHTYGNWWTGRNVLYVGKRVLEPTTLGTSLPGAGVFDQFHERLCLSDPASNYASCWRLPRNLRPNPARGMSMSYLEKGTWTQGEDTRFVHLNPGYIRKWQESVISNNPSAVDWAVGLIRDLSG